ncbi:SIMPL domain-containing protein [Cohnella faecalis]|uniref:DUF541 domain-containing protein n=1 Tax=Cohnella faecalis TaxID=2315694 RepID=A0A398CGD3_9BACL|nr:SIMPL domain-containing protein [Cohnella faecalis]RIE01012.1 DUF541 domain-containing protein [Cohnella faecalis]
MKQRSWQVLTVALAVVVIGWIGFGKGEGTIVAAETPTTASAQSAVVNTVTVGASGSILVEPDVAYLNVSVDSQGTTANAAQKANADKFAAVEKALYEKYGISKKDVKTTGFYVQPEYNYTEKEGRKLTGYNASHSLQVTYRKLDGIGKLLDDLTAAGANRTDGVQFSTEKKDQYELDALKQAMANADAKAGVLAVSAKRQLGGVLNIVQGNAQNVPVIMYDQVAKVASESGASASSSVQVGQIEISASVTVQYGLK